MNAVADLSLCLHPSNHLAPAPRALASGRHSRPCLQVHAYHSHSGWDQGQVLQIILLGPPLKQTCERSRSIAQPPLLSTHSLTHSLTHTDEVLIDLSEAAVRAGVGSRKIPIFYVAAQAHVCVEGACLCVRLFSFSLSIIYTYVCVLSATISRRC